MVVGSSAYTVFDRFSTGPNPPPCREGLRDQSLRALGEDSPVTAFVGIGGGRATDGGADGHVVQLGRLCAKHGFDVAEAFAVVQLREGQHTEVFGAEQAADVVVATKPFGD